ncbi:hypothetical protein JAAARDRAFT_205162 [Jaapia argillacea MUCL 33604]|uniref:FAD dependent oxidoreductase domain-containing protein n=1 Tax=Jaapia argillacea MUCL 33604 TaxID=933084 RepID=A0A067PZK2_9AGAM|nr:hypothetical protein JAAARDRAFT_205162 [Jaapia argillacea MUCL 33604]
MLGKNEIVVVGAGVVGLTTAIRVQETGRHRVTVIAETFPTDPKTIKYTSHWAGAHLASGIGADATENRIGTETFRAIWEMSAPGSETEGCFLRVRQTQFYAEEQPEPHPLHIMPGFEYLPQSSLPKGFKSGIGFTTVDIDTPKYLNYLLARFLARGGSTIRGTVQHISQIIEGGPHVFSNPMGKSTGDTSPVDAVIVVVGGTQEPDDWHPVPRERTKLDTLTRAISCYPELVPAKSNVDSHQVSVDDILDLVIEDGCGLRPARKGGVRIEVELFEDAQRNRRVPVVHNYGHEGSGFEWSWGSAAMVLDLLNDALSIVPDSRN